MKFLTVEKLFKTCKDMIDKNNGDYLIQYPDDTGVLNATYTDINDENKTLSIGAD